VNDTALIVRAAAFAAERHREQRRKDADASPYINHPIALADVLANEGNVTGAIVLAAALLHDTIEDTATTARELAEVFGEDVAGIVLEVTDDKSLPKAERKERQVEHASQLSSRARLVKLADNICNLRDVSQRPSADWSIERRPEYFDWSKRVIDGLHDGANPKLEDLFDAKYARRP
jgi:GTP diphosphokinase / guanosine-3',5'-bis(diphosphate) 3'-diphosphatase